MTEGGAAIAAGSSQQWTTRIVVLAAALVVGMMGYVIGTSVLPRSWSRFVASTADGRYSVAVTAGILCGSLFTALPLLALRESARRGRPSRDRIIAGAVAVVAAMPNLITLGVVLGSGAAAADGRAILDVDAPGFRGSTLVGVVLGVALVAAVWLVVADRRRHKRQIAALREEIKLLRPPAS